MIEKLTVEQEENIIKTRDKWLDRVFKKREVNNLEIIDGINWLYKYSGHKRPFVWFCESPMMCQVIANILKDNIRDNIGANIWDNIGANIWDNIGDNIWYNIGANIWDNIGDNIRANIGDNIGANIWDNIRDNIGDNIWYNIGANIWDNIGDNIRANIGDNIGANIWDNIGDNIRANIGDNIRANIGDNIGANIWDNIRDNIGDNKKLEYNHPVWISIGSMGWIAWEEYCIENKLIATDKEKEFLKLRDLIKSGYYDAITMDGLCIVSVLPKYLFWRELRGRRVLHSIDSPAIEWGDGYKLFFIDGVCFNEKLFRQVTSGNMTFKEVMKLENIEQRYIAIKLMDVNSLIKESKAKLIDKSGKGNELYSATIDKINVMFLKYSCPSTGRVYMKFVENSFSDADEAQAWSFSLTKKEYLSIRQES